MVKSYCKYCDKIVELGDGTMDTICPNCGCDGYGNTRIISRRKQ